MKIAIVCDVYGRINNGTIMAAHNLITYLKERGHTVTVICPDKTKENTEGFVVLKKRNLGPINLIVARNDVVLAKVNKRVIENAVKDCDIVHCMMPFVTGVAALRIAKKHNIPVTAGFHCQAENVTCHLGLQHFGPANRFIYKRFYRRLFKHTDAIHYPTLFIRDVFEKIVGPTPGYIISNGINENIKPVKTEKPEEFKGKYVILSTGRLCYEKSHMVILKAVRKSKYAKDIQLIFAGTGPLHKKLVKYAKKHLPVQPLIKFFPREELVKALNYSDLYVHPAEIELEGIACLEAIVCGLVPVVSDSKRSATKNFALTPYNICECNNPNSLRDRIEYWIEHLDEKKQLSEEYIRFGAGFDKKDCMSKMEQMMFDVVEKNKRKLSGE